MSVNLYITYKSAQGNLRYIQTKREGFEIVIDEHVLGKHHYVAVYTPNFRVNIATSKSTLNKGIAIAHKILKLAMHNTHIDFGYFGAKIIRVHFYSVQVIPYIQLEID